MTKRKKKIDLTSQVMEEIKIEKVKMRPRGYFIAGAILLGIGLGGVIVLTTVFVNLVFFRLRIHQPFGFLGFGGPGLRPFISAFPWLFLLLATSGIIGGIEILKRYDISYKRNLWQLVIMLVGVIVALGFLLNIIGFNEKVSKIKTWHQVMHGKSAGQDWVVGNIEVVEENKLIITTPCGTRVAVFWNEQTHLPHGSDFNVSQQIRAIGEWQDGLFTAIGIDHGKFHRQQTSPRVKGLRRRF